MVRVAHRPADTVQERVDNAGASDSLWSHAAALGRHGLGPSAHAAVPYLVSVLFGLVWWQVVIDFRACLLCFDDDDGLVCLVKQGVVCVPGDRSSWRIRFLWKKPGGHASFYPRKAF